MCLDLKIYEDYERNQNRNSRIAPNKSEVVEVNFNVISKRTGITYEVYAVDSNRFLIFFNGNFEWQPMNQFRPVKTTQQERMKKESIEKSTMFTKRQAIESKPLYP